MDKKLNLIKISLIADSLPFSKYPVDFLFGKCLISPSTNFRSNSVVELHDEIEIGSWNREVQNQLHALKISCASLFHLFFFILPFLFSVSLSRFMVLSCYWFAAKVAKNFVLDRLNEENKCKSHY